jgi:hypothetical protein
MKVTGDAQKCTSCNLDFRLNSWRAKISKNFGILPESVQMPAGKKAKVSLNALARDFEERLNYYPEVRPVTFNSDQLAFQRANGSGTSDRAPRHVSTTILHMGHHTRGY